jgi:transcriptional regulator with XRE-family HTH domain
MEDAGQLLKAARKRAGISQRRLALRAGTSQDAISRIERGRETPTFDRLERLLEVMGERLIAGVAPAEPVLAPDELAVAKSLSPEQRLRESASWNLATTKLEIAGEQARQRGDPATRRSAP